MTATTSVLQLMLERVARALGPDLCQQMTFVGGGTTGLLLTDEYTKEQVRYTVARAWSPVNNADLKTLT